MSTEKPQSWPRRILRIVGKVVFYGIAGALTLLVVAHFVWKYSGSNQWELEIDRDNVQVYSLKTPGESMKDFRAVTKIKSKLNAVVASMASRETEDCAAWAPSCRSLRSVEEWDPKKLTYIHLYRLNYPKPFSPREFLLNAKITQDPKTKVVLVEFTALPDKLPKNDCCVRVEHMHNTWKFTPIGNGEVEVELRTDMDPGVPYFMFNKMNPIFMHRMFRGPLQKWFEKEKWQQARFEGIVEQ